MLSVNRSLTAAQAKAILVTTGEVITITDSEGDSLTARRLNAAKAVELANKCATDPSCVTEPIVIVGGPYHGIQGTGLGFDSSQSMDFYGGNLTFAWDFGDGGVGSGPTPTHVYAQAGVFSVRLTVTDGRGRQAVATTTATIAPACTGQTVVANTFGDTYQFSPALGLGAGPSFMAVRLAVAFTPGSLVRLAAIELQVGLSVGPNILDVQVAQDANGQPGTPIETTRLNGAMPSGFTFPNPLVLATSQSRPSLAAGTQYWVIVSLPGPDAAGSWNFPLPSSVGLMASQVDNGSWSVHEGPRPALRVTGMPASCGSP
jgi:hypothetical protein